MYHKILKCKLDKLKAFSYSYLKDIQLLILRINVSLAGNVKEKIKSAVAINFISFAG